MREVYDDMKADKEKKKQVRREENLACLRDNNIQWKWIDEMGDHILINNEIDYYLGKTYWFNRKTKKSGYAMLKKLHLIRGKQMAASERKKSM